MLDEVSAALSQLRGHEDLMEVRAEFEPAPRRFGIVTRPRMLVQDRVWRLGALLLRADGELFLAGDVTRAVPPPKADHNSPYRSERQVYTAAAYRAKLPTGTVVHFNTRPVSVPTAAHIDPNQQDPNQQNPNSPLILLNGVVHLRWIGGRADSGLVPLGAYLTERVDLLLNPPPPGHMPLA